MRFAMRITLAAALSLAGAAPAGAERPSQVRLVVEPGPTSDGTAYHREAIVMLDGQRIGGRLVVRSERGAIERAIKLRGLQPGREVTVSATFVDPQGGSMARCERSWSITAANSIGCGSIAVGYEAATGSCNIECD